MEVDISFFFAVITAFAAIHLVQAQNQTGFISLDCGLEPKDTVYTEKTTNITYTSDWKYTDRGESQTIKSDYQPKFQQQLWSLRSFPVGTRNCYNFNLTKGDKYLIRPSFVYGNYDDQNTLPEFDLYVGPNKWTSVQITGVANASVFELVHVLTSDRLQVCLVKTGSTVPFISSLELRPLNSNSYVTQSGSLSTFLRVYFTPSVGFIRFDEDPLDRLWVSFFSNDLTPLSTNLTVDTNNVYEPPELAMRNAATPTISSQPLSTQWTFSNPSTQIYLYLHFAEIEMLPANEIREFNVIFNGQPWYGPISPSNLTATTIFSSKAISSADGSYQISLVRTERSTLPPLINAAEVYTVLELPLSETNKNDVDAILNIKAIYGITKTSWEGDPCAPQELSWEGLNCSYPGSDQPRITSLDLSSSSLTGEITPYIYNLTDLQALDLSNNNLTGGIPEELAGIRSLSFINLSGNQLNGTIPTALLQRIKDGSLTLDFNGAQVCPPDYCPEKYKSKVPVVPIAASVASGVVVIALLAVFFIFRGKKQTLSSDPTFITKQRRFTYSEVLSMTNNFERVLGTGGFGTVYHGYLDNTQVAVKMLSQSSAQGYQQFKAEVELLLRVHHRNLVSLVGYCNDGQNVALIYEYMANGDLKEHLSGKRGGNVLSWASRLRIAVEAAQGLEYLHNGSKPAMVHRDVKSSNILLNEDLRAKLADFGLSRSFPIEGESHVSTVVAGTPGYLDPEYHRTARLSEKSDVYSFGIVLLEIITNRPVIDRSHHKPHIPEWVGTILTNGDINNIVDPKLRGNFSVNSVWKAVEVAMACVNPSSSERPTMPQVVMDLNECLGAEMARIQGRRERESKDSPDLSMSFASEFDPGAR